MKSGKGNYYFKNYQVLENMFFKYLTNEDQIRRYEDWVMFNGFFSENKITDSGMLKYSNGDIYTGSFTNGVPEGEGVLVL